MLQMSLVQLILNGTAKTKLAILAFLCCGEFVKTPNCVVRQKTERVGATESQV